MFIQIYAIHYSICAYTVFNFATPSACLPACKYNLWSRRMSLTKEKPLSPKRVVPDKITNARYSFDLLLSDRRRWRTYVQGQVIGRNVSLYRHLLRLGLLLALARVSKVRVPVGLWSVRRTLYHTLHRRQYALHGIGSSRHGQRYGKSTQVWQLREYHTCKCSIGKLQKNNTSTSLIYHTV